jgi:hypothetical membrane protein
MTQVVVPGGITAAEHSEHATRVTRSLLRWGVVAGPFYVTVALAQALTRDGFDLTKHSWSLLANGDLGWIQITNLIVTGLMVIAAAVGLRRALRPGRGSMWGSLLLGAYGLCMIAAGVFRADPAQGFPAGTPETTTVSAHGLAHFVFGGLGFLGLIAACFVLAGRFVRDGRRDLAWFSRITGVVFLAGFVGIASGSHGPTTVTFVAAILIAWSWLSTVSLHLYRNVPSKNHQ